MDIDKASAEQLESAFQVDGPRARYLVNHRSKLGGFTNWQQVKQIPRFEDKMVENLEGAGLTIDLENGDENRAAEVRASKASLDVNRASAEELERVAQIDGTRARHLIEARERVGGFEPWDQIKREAPSFEDGIIERLQRSGARLG